MSKSKPTPHRKQGRKLRAARHAKGLTQTEAGRVVYTPLRTWQQWEAGSHPCHPAIFELFLIKTGQLTAR